MSGLDLLIRGGEVVDGTGSDRRRADVAIEGDRIAAVGRLDGANATTVIDAEGLIVCPGFIDPHSHTDFTILGNPTQESTIRQGVTTEVVGNCGIGCFPLSAHSRPAARERLKAYAYDGPADWETFGDFWAAVAAEGTSANFASFVPHSPVRTAAGVEEASLSREQLAEMKRSVHASMEAGALGMSTGLEYESGRFAGRDELLALARVVGEHGGIYASHIRNRDVHLAEAVAEFMALAEAAGGRGQVSHLNVRHNTGAREGAWEAAVDAVAAARAAGMDILADATPMTTGDGVMSGILPPWLMAEGPERAATLLRDPEIRRRLRGDCDRYWRFIARGEWDRVRLLSSAEYPELCGLTFPEIADRLGVDEWDAYFDILSAAGRNIDGPSLIATLFTEEMSRATVGHPLFLLGSDTMSATIDGRLSEQTRNPLHFAAHTYFLVHHVREAATLSLEEAVRKMTSMVAARFGLRDRGVLAPGAYADVVVFDFERLRACSTIERPLAYSEGVEHVLVNGSPVVGRGSHTGARPGRFLSGVA